MRATCAFKMGNVLARNAHAKPVGDRSRRLDLHALAALERALRVISILRLDADDLRLRKSRVHRDGAARHQAAARDRTVEAIDRAPSGGGVFEHLERERALACGDQRMIVRRYRYVAARLRDLRGHPRALVAIGTDRDDLRA